MQGKAIPNTFWSCWQEFLKVLKVLAVGDDACETFYNQALG